MKAILNNKTIIKLSFTIGYLVVSFITNASAAEVALLKRYDQYPGSPSPQRSVRSGAANELATSSQVQETLNSSEGAKPSVLNSIELAKLDKISPIQDLMLLGSIEDGAEKLSLFTSLRTLDVSNATFGEKFLYQLSLRTTLEGLNLRSRRAITDQALLHLCSLLNLRVLDISSTYVFGPGLASLSSLTNIEKLDCSHTHVVGEHFLPLKDLPKLRELKVLCTLVGAGELPAFKSHPSIQRSSIHDE